MRRLVASYVAAGALLVGIGWTLGHFTTPTTIAAAPSPTPTPCTVTKPSFSGTEIVGPGHYVQVPPEGRWVCWLNEPSR